MTNFLKNTFFGLIVAVIFLTIAELSIRFILPFPLNARRTYTVDESSMYFHASNSYGYQISEVGEFPPVKLEYNKYGFRGTYNEIPFGKKIIALLGDSYIESRQVKFENTFGELLTAQNPDYFFINAGVSAFTTTNEYFVLRDKIVRFKPKKVFQFFIFNDYSDNYGYRGGYYTQKNIFDVTPDSKFQPKAYQNSKQSFRKYLESNFAIFAYMKRFTQKPIIKNSLLDRAKSTKFYKNLNLINKPESEMDEIELEILNFTHEGVKRSAKLAKEIGAQFYLVIVPHPVQVGGKEWAAGRKKFGYNVGDVMQGNLYQIRLQRLCLDGGFTCVDLLPHFKKAYAQGKRMFLEFDGHFTYEAHEVLADVLKPFVLDSVPFSRAEVDTITN